MRERTFTPYMCWSARATTSSGRPPGRPTATPTLTPMDSGPAGPRTIGVSVGVAVGVPGGRPDEVVARADQERYGGNGRARGRG